MGKKNNQRDRQRKKAIQRKKEAKPTRVKSVSAPAPTDEVNNPVPQPSRTTKYTSLHRTLVVGDGDFSFSRGLARHRGAGAGLLATAFDSEKIVAAKYKKFEECRRGVEAAGGKVQFSVDGTKLQKCGIEGTWDRIIFNFPHSGKQRVHVNRVLLHDFFESAVKQLNPGGQVHVTLKDKPPYNGWNIEEQAAPHGLVLREKLPFCAKEFPGYRHCTTLANAEEFEAFEKHCRTWHFGRSIDPYAKSSHDQKAQKKKRQRENEAITATRSPTPQTSTNDNIVNDGEDTKEAKKPKFVIEFD